MDKTEFEKQLATLSSLTDWGDADAILEALETARREIYIKYRTGEMDAEEFRALSVLASCMEHKALDSMMAAWEEEAKAERM